ncbi:hypothetical protein FHS00_003460 [Limimaricola variabilis]|uniref:EF-hand domain-containing protein n=1 Tax=Limimaricola variabilis TaxID=1492771 RepID=A0ABR6HTF9_9RHOB|nr:hypothetical protein [Limimaricola variabilis]MBB3713853.1 hypothetical protein [Limimaricola variabilis]
MKHLLSSAAFVVLGSGMALAQSDVTTNVYTDNSFCTSDYSPATDGDQEEQSRTEFAEMDLDDDGMVSQDEYIECRKAATGDSEASGSSDGGSVDNSSDSGSSDSDASDSDSSSSGN